MKDPSIRTEQRDRMVQWMEGELLSTGSFTEEVYEGKAAGIKRALIREIHED